MVERRRLEDAAKVLRLDDDDDDDDDGDAGWAVSLPAFRC